jgi:aryl-alcohol dehydrogenase-like predicted oxidoreductase
VQFFWWDTNIGTPIESLEVLKKCKAKGKIANLGITNWDVDQSSKFKDAGFDLVSNQVQYSLLDRRASFSLAPWCSENDIGLLCYGTLAGGFLTEKWLGQPDPGFIFENRSLVKYRLVIDEFGSWEDFQGLLNILKEIADKYKVSLGSVATKWVLNQPQVAAAIVGARYASRLPSTLEVFKFELDAIDNNTIESYLNQHSALSGPVYSVERDRKGRHGKIMKYNLNTKANDKVGEN